MEIQRRWKEAIEKTREGLAPEDREIAERLTSPESIVDDLSARHEQRQNSAWTQLRIQLMPFLHCLNSFSLTFVAAMGSHAIKMSIAWGFLSLALMVSW